MFFFDKISKILLILIVSYAMSVFLINRVTILKNLALSYIEPQFEVKLGNQKVSSGMENKIYALANKLGIQQKFKIRKMNFTAIRAFGYCNAAVYSPTFAHIIPIDSPSMIISEGFLEDLSEDEQTFIIGHELIHLRDKHPTYVIFYAILLLLLAALTWHLFKSKILIKLKKFNFFKKYIFTYYFIVLLSLIVALVVSNIIFSFYQKRIEFIADRDSLKVLNSYKGALQLIEKWKSDFKQPEKYNYFGLFATHPSHEERKTYCLTMGKIDEKN